MFLSSGYFLPIIYFTLLGFVSSKALPPGPKLIIDHDGGADDAMAILMALLYEEYFEGPRVIALTTCHGNVNETQVYINSQRILDLGERPDVPIYRGQTKAILKDYPTDGYYGLDGLGDLDDVKYNPIPAQPEHAVQALIDMSKKYEGELTIITLAPSTNIAMAMKMDDEFVHRLAHLYIAGGNIYSEDHPDAEFNAYLDVEAYYIITENAIPEKVTFIPFSPFYAVHNISMDWRENVLGSINTNIISSLNDFERIANTGNSVWTSLDPCAMAMVLDQDLIQEQRCSNNTIILCGDRRGINTNDFTDCDKSNVKLALPAPDDGYKNFYLDVFSAELNSGS